MAYILAVNPAILSEAGMPAAELFTAVAGTARVAREEHVLAAVVPR